MAKLIRRSEALRRINALEEQCAASGDRKGGEWIVRAFNAIMSCKVEEKLYCPKCGRELRREKTSEGGSEAESCPDK